MRTTYAYFVDNLSATLEAGAIPTDVVPIGELSKGQRADLINDGRVVGMSCALNDRQFDGRNLWPLIAGLLPKSIDDNNRLQVADSILKAVLTYPGEFLSSAETRANSQGGYSIWAQDFEFAPGGLSQEEVNQVYAGVIAVLWAGRQVLGDAARIIPVPSSSLFKNLSNPDIATLLSSSGLLAPLQLSNLPLTNTQKGANGQWNVLSVLHHNGLIDGFLGQQYSSNNPDALPGSISTDTRAFDGQDNLPYAILSSIQQLQSTSLDGPPWSSHYDGAMPFQAGVYFPDAIPANFNPAKELIPQQDGLISSAIATLQDTPDDVLLDLRSLEPFQQLTVDVNASREADFQSQVGFYVVQDAEGAVVDPLSGALIRPGDAGYQQAALSPRNSVTPLQGLEAEDDGSSDRQDTLQGGALIAPVVEVLEPGQEAIYFAFAAANADGFNHFRRLGSNRIGMEDLPGGGDQDFNDLTMTFSFFDVR
ncbi:hemolysin-type calcium-binding repeat family protein [Synechococcus sp. RS9909]|uniref:DUF4114 domain-containing protein n=1 Tax=unclassified Synechococcus TaxID=2626047 RepID=UPI000068FC8B|nr:MULTISPECIES: DUF4114 domain-containing protein [unclassified Synechococcus]EAQ68034.1 hypothetical protein RS9917_01826 [Synechococcus sp. RS9917]QNI78804.1 hemolysin-type calcium-binding repeat family protein [Synechococcus sp. RS9909]